MQNNGRFPFDWKKLVRILLQMEQYNFSSGKNAMGAAVPFDKILLFPGRAWVLKLGNNKHGWRIFSGVLKFCWMIFTHFTLSKKMTCLWMFSMATLIARRSLNRCYGYFEQTVPFYIPLMNFKATSVTKEDSGHGR